MTELDLYKFISENELEIDWRGGDMLLLWMDSCYVDDFARLTDRCDADDGGIDCQIQRDGTIVLDLTEICEEYEINPKNILEQANAN